MAEARADEERRRRKLQAGLAAAVLALTAVGGLGTGVLPPAAAGPRPPAWSWILRRASTLLARPGRGHPDDPAQWQAALAAIQRVEDLLGGGTGSDADDPAASAGPRDEVRPAGDGGRARPRSCSIALVDIRSAEADDPDGSATDAAYAEAFREAGLDLAALSPAEARGQIRARPPATALALAAALDDWAAVRRKVASDSDRGDG